MNGSFYLILLGFIIFILSGCSHKPIKIDGATQEEKHLQLIALESSISSLKLQQDWLAYIDYSTELWTNVDSENKLAIEYEIWQTLKNIPDEQRQELLEENPEKIELTDWLEFVYITELYPIEQKQQLKDSLTFNPHAVFNANLSHSLINQLKSSKKPEHVAVLLPFSGNYKQVSLQIRNGIIKNKLQNNPQLTLSFYDSSNTEQIKEIYQKSIENGADFVIGPIQKETLNLLNSPQQMSVDKQAILTLNENPMPNLTFSSRYEGVQITKKLCSENYKNIAILTSNNNSDADLATQIFRQWKQFSGNNATLKVYPEKKANLRKALASVINEQQSNDRKNNLQWLLRINLSFFPRTRQDLDAVVLLGNTKQLAVFQPQFKFFNLTIPTYSSSKLTPTNLQKNKPNMDLKNISFPTYRAVLINNGLISKLEAFGWDSLTIALNQHLFAPNLCLNSGMSGNLSKDGLVYDRQYIWAKYNQDGIIE
jgi:outer membrane PBP1 activator LpoA protein